MSAKSYEEIGPNYRFFLAWRHAAFAGNIVVLGGACTLLTTAYEKSVPVAWPIPLLAALVAFCLWLADRRTRQIYRSLTRAGKEMENPCQGAYHALDGIGISKDAPWFPTKGKPLCKFFSQSFALDCFFLGSALILLAATFYVAFHPPRAPEKKDSGSSQAVERTGAPPSSFDAALSATNAQLQVVTNSPGTGRAP